MKPFIDEIKIGIQSGRGGNGIVSFRREKFVPKGGPDGGDGGKGGDVVFMANSRLNTLSHLYPNKVYKADNGKNGAGAKRTGKSGKTLLIEVPTGTQIYDYENNLLHDFEQDGEKYLALEGGIGGAGNYHYSNSVDQTPRKAKQGLPGEKLKIKLVLKIIADIGLVGFPNAGKSTFLSMVSKASPKIGAYPFTTLRPNLGTFSYDGIRNYVIADIPGLIEGASSGKGLGIQFLKHIERTRILLFILDGLNTDYSTQYKQLLEELKKFNPQLLHKQRVVAISKSDIDFVNEEAAKYSIEHEDENIKVFSSMSMEGIREILDILSKKCDYIIRELKED